jgi:hypothetical protein
LRFSHSSRGDFCCIGVKQPHPKAQTQRTESETASATAKKRNEHAPSATLFSAVERGLSLREHVEQPFPERQEPARFVYRAKAAQHVEE